MKENIKTSKHLLMNKKTLVIGASENPDRYSNKAANLLQKHQHEVVLFGKTGGQINGIEIQKQLPNRIDDLDTITLYINPTHQEAVKNDLLALKPKRIIFNPGTENPIFEAEASKAGIATENACTLVLLNLGQY